MVTVATCTDLAQAELIKSILEGSGVAAFVPDENSVLWGNVIGGFRVQVAEEEVNIANDVLRQSGEFPSETPVALD
jgi:hypothetical protein